MSSVLLFFEPTQDALVGWGVKVILLAVGSAVFVWLLALILARTRLLVRTGAELKVDFAWAAAFMVNAALLSVLLISISKHYRSLDIAWEYAIPFLAMVLVSGALGMVMNSRAKDLVSDH